MQPKVSLGLTTLQHDTLTDYWLAPVARPLSRPGNRLTQKRRSRAEEWRFNSLASLIAARQLMAGVAVFEKEA